MALAASDLPGAPLYRSLLVALCLVLAPLGAGAQAIAPEFAATPTSGFAPLAVHFDATATRHASPSVSAFHDLVYHWDFGDPGSGNWTTGAQLGSRNEDYGPIAGHVFEQPGTYPVRLRVYDGVNPPAERVATIEVSDPNAVFPAERTACVARSGSSWTGCPAGARRVVRTDGNFDAAMETARGSGRILFRRGETWTAIESVRISGPTDGILGAFGVGAAPAVAYSGADALFPVDGVCNWRIMDLAVTGNGSNLFSSGTGSRMTFVRLELRTFRSMFFHEGDLVTIYDSSLAGTSGDGGNVLFCPLTRGLILGNDARDSLQGEHVFRLPEFTRSVLAHNTVASAKEDKHLIKLHASTAYTAASEFFVIRDNFLDNTHSGIAVQLAPQNESSNCNEVVRQGIFESNFLRTNPSGGFAMWLIAENVTVRNNVFDMSAVTGGFEAIWSRAQGCQPLPRDNAVLHNTIYGATTQTATAVVLQVNPVNTTVRNNLLHSPGASQISVLQDGGTGTLQSGNYDDDGEAPALPYTGAPFVSPTPVQLLDFRLAPAGPAAPVLVDTGGVVPRARIDLRGANRAGVGPGPAPGDDAFDIGAFEVIP